MEKHTRTPDLALEIIKRESGGWPSICNKTYDCGAGQGLMQIIHSTERTCEAHFGREMDMLDGYDNLDCGLWLLDNGRGIGHWDDMSWKRGEIKEWGSGPYQFP